MINKTQSPNLVNEPETAIRRALLVLNVILGATAVITIAYYIIAWQTQAWQMFTLATVILAFGGLTLVARRLVQNGRLSTGIIITLAGMFIIFPAASLLVADLGSVLSLALLGLAIAITLQTLPPHIHLRLVATTIVIGLLTYFLDLFGGDYRLSVPQLRSIVTVITVLVLAVYAIFIIRNFASYSLRTKLILAFLTVSLLSGGIVILITTNTIRTNLLQDIGDNLNNVATTRAAAMGDVLARQTDLLITLSLNATFLEELGTAVPQATLAELEAIDQQWRAADDSDPLIQNSLNNSLADELRTFQQNFPQHVELFLTDQQGALIATTNRTSDYYQADEEWWQVAYSNGQGGTHISQPEFDESSQALGLQMAVPIFAADNSIIGVLRSTYQANAFSDILAPPRQGEGISMDVYLPDGNELEWEDGIVELVVDEGYDEWYALALSDNIFMQVAHDNEPSIVSAALVGDIEQRSEVASLNWILLTNQPEAIGLAAIIDQQRNTVLLVIGVALLSIAIAFALSQYLTQPALALVDAVTQVQAGDLATRVAVRSGDEMGTLGSAFNEMTEQLQISVGRLERRNRAIETSTAVGQHIASILEPKRLATAVVQQVQQTFHYYHAHIYLWDEASQKLVVAGGTGKAGAQMLNTGHALSLGQGLVGRAAATNEAILVADVSQEEGWLPNPLLPETVAETAVPISIGDQVLGVLDVQHNVKDGLRQLDVELLQAVASQIAVALQNARTYEQVRHQAQQEALINSISQSIERATTIEGVLDVTARELRRAMGAKHTIVELSVQKQQQKTSQPNGNLSEN